MVQLLHLHHPHLLRPPHHLLHPHLRLLHPQVLLQVTAVDIDPNDYYNLDISKDGLALLYRSVCFHLEKWPGGHPEEQEALVQMKDNLFRIILEKTLET